MLKADNKENIEPADIDCPTIMHIDMNAFFASCEQARNPDLIGKPVVVGGSSERGVVSAASYEARVLGVHAGMPNFQATKLSPDLVFLPVDIEYYALISAKIFALIADYTYQIEKVGIDEGFVDVSGAVQLFGSPKQIARLIIDRIYDEMKIKCTIGIGRCKSVAKLASGLAKPTNKRGQKTKFSTSDGILVIKDSETEDFLRELPISMLYGVGKKSAEKLRGIGVNTVEDLLQTPRSAVLSKLGVAMCKSIYLLATGNDSVDVDYHLKPPKSIGRELTLMSNTRDWFELNNVLIGVSDDIASQLREHQYVCESITLIIKTADHMRHSKALTLETTTNSAYVILCKAQELLRLWLLEDTRDIRLIGVTTARFADAVYADGVQSIFDAVDSGKAIEAKMKTVEQTIDRYREKMDSKKQIANVQIGFVEDKHLMKRKMMH